MRPRQSESVRLPLPNGDVLCVHISAAEPETDWAVVYVHGLASNRIGEKSRALETACAGRDWTFVAFDFRGHGESSGSLLELRASALLEDLDALSDYLAGRGLNRLCLVGASMGGWAAAWFAVRHPNVVPACVLIAPAFDFPGTHWTRLTATEQQHWRETGRRRVQNEWIDTELGFCLVEEVGHYPAEHLCADWSRPLLIFHGMLDEVVPFGNTIALVESMAYPDVELRLFRGGEHRLNQFKEEIGEASCAFFARHIASKDKTVPMEVTTL